MAAVAGRGGARRVGLVAAAIVVALGASACAAKRFRAICHAAAPGERVVDVAARLEAAGGGYVGKMGPAYHWTRSTGFFKTANCLVSDDQPPAVGAPDRFKRLPPDARVTATRYVEGDDLL